jgi:hypothetical protein
MAPAMPAAVPAMRANTVPTTRTAIAPQPARANSAPAAIYPAPAGPPAKQSWLKSLFGSKSSPQKQNQYPAQIQPYQNQPQYQANIPFRYTTTSPPVVNLTRQPIVQPSSLDTLKTDLERLESTGNIQSAEIIADVEYNGQYLILTIPAALVKGYLSLGFTSRKAMTAAVNSIIDNYQSGGRRGSDKPKRNTKKSKPAKKSKKSKTSKKAKKN